MAWIELHQTLPTNRKTIRLKNILKIKIPQAVGHLCILWLWALDNAPDGDLSKFTADEIAECAGWVKSPEEFLNALQSAEFIDDDKRIHNWELYTGRLIEQREIQREQSRVRQQKRRDKLKTDNAGVTRDESVSHAGITRSPYPTVPNPTVPYLTNTGDITTTPTTREKSPPAFGVVCDAYMQRYGQTPSSSVQDDLLYFSGIVEADAIIHAFDVAVAERVLKWSYVKAILREYERDGVKTIEQVRLRELDRENQKSAPAQPSKQSKNKTFLEIAEEMMSDDSRGNLPSVEYSNGGVPRQLPQHS